MRTRPWHGYQTTFLASKPRVYATIDHQADIYSACSSESVGQT